MGTIIDYLKEYGEYMLEEKGFNEVDSLALSQFAYLKFDGLAPEIGVFRKCLNIRIMTVCMPTSVTERTIRRCFSALFTVNGFMR